MLPAAVLTRLSYPSVACQRWPGWAR